MVASSESESPSGLIDLKGDGRIVLYKRTGLKKPKWQVRIRVPNATGYRIVSECHHIKPVSELEPGGLTNLADATE